MLSEKRDEIVRQAAEKVRVYMPFHHSCSKGVNHALQDAFGLREEGVFKASGGLHGGIGGNGDACGALLGSSLIMGLLTADGMDKGAPPEDEREPGPDEEKDVPTRLVSDLYEWFMQEYGSIKCAELRGGFEAEVAAEAAAKGLSEEEQTMLSMSRCDEMASRAAARAAGLLCDVLE